VDIATIARPAAKATWCVKDPAEVAPVMREAFHTARSGRPGPVLIDLPIDVQMPEVDYRPEEDRRLPWFNPVPDRNSIEKAMDLIATSKAPIMILGGGVILADATAEFRELAEYLSIPIGNRYFLESDLVIGVGCRFTDRHTGKVETYVGRRLMSSPPRSGGWSPPSWASWPMPGWRSLPCWRKPGTAGIVRSPPIG
jgi:tartronate-semialdehyde synthase